MNTTVFNLVVKKHSLQPGNLLYNSNALCGETGEVANIVKKMQFEKIKPEWSNEGVPSIIDLNKNLKDELGDALFYLTRVAADAGYTLGAIMSYQHAKLKRQSKQYNRLFLK